MFLTSLTTRCDRNQVAGLLVIRETKTFLNTSSLSILAYMTSSFVPTMCSGSDSDLRNLVFADNSSRCSRTVAANGTTSCEESLSYVVLAGCNVTRSSSASHDTESTMSLQSCRAGMMSELLARDHCLLSDVTMYFIPQTQASIFVFTSYVTAMINDHWACQIVDGSLYFGCDESKISRTVRRS